MAVVHAGTDLAPAAPEADPDPAPRPAGPRVTWGRTLLAVTLLALAATLVVHVSPWVAEGFGTSHDGFNGATWGLAARGARADPIGNRLGGVHPDGYRYANHPPLLVWTATATTAVVGESPFALRAPALLASLAALALLALLLLDAGLAPGAVAAGLAVAGTTGMFLTYGALVDTPVFSFPVGLAALAAAQRAWQGRPPPRWVLAALGALAALAGWQALLATGLATLLAHAGPGREGRRAARWLGAGLAGGLALTVAWIAWVQGTLARLGDQAATRTRTGTADWFGRQELYLGDLYGPAVLAVTAAGLAVALLLAPTRVRPLVAVVAATVVLYTLAFREGSQVHDYWTFWGVALVAGTVAALAHAISAWARPRPLLVARAVPAVLVVAVLALAVAGATHRSRADGAIRDGVGAAEVLALAPRALDPRQSTVAVRRAEDGAPWADFVTHGSAATPTPEELAQLPPDRLVFLVTIAEPDAEVRAAAIAIDGRNVLMAAGDYQRITG